MAILVLSAALEMAASAGLASLFSRYRNEIAYSLLLMLITTVVVSTWYDRKCSIPQEVIKSVTDSGRNIAMDALFNTLIPKNKNLDNPVSSVADEAESVDSPDTDQR